MNRRQLAADHLWIARYHAKRLCGKIDYWELLSVGHLALVQAAKQWPGKQEFGPYAAARIQWRMRDAIRRTRDIGEPVSDEPGLPEPDSECVYYGVREFLDRLPADERQAVRMAYGIGTRKRNTVAVARAMRIGHKQARKIIQSGLLRLRFMATVEQVNGGKESCNSS